MIDRFGPLPIEVQHLLKIVYIKSLCRTANVEKLDAGPRGVVVQFRNKEFPNPANLVGYIAKQGTLAKIRPDHSLFLTARPADAGKAAAGRGRDHDAACGAGRKAAPGGKPDCPPAFHSVDPDARQFIPARLRPSPRRFPEAPASTSAVCAPLTAYCWSKMKKGTPVTPMRLPCSISDDNDPYRRPKRAAAVTGAVETGLLGDIEQHRMIADIAAFLEIRLEQRRRRPCLHLAGPRHRPTDQAVRIERVRADLDGLEIELDADFAAIVGQHLVRLQPRVRRHRASAPASSSGRCLAGG